MRQNRVNQIISEEINKYIQENTMLNEYMSWNPKNWGKQKPTSRENEYYGLDTLDNSALNDINGEDLENLDTNAQEEERQRREEAERKRQEEERQRQEAEERQRQEQEAERQRVATSGETQPQGREQVQPQPQGNGEQPQGREQVQPQPQGNGGQTPPQGNVQPQSGEMTGNEVLVPANQLNNLKRNAQQIQNNANYLQRYATNVNRQVQTLGTNTQR